MSVFRWGAVRCLGRVQYLILGLILGLMLGTLQTSPAAAQSTRERVSILETDLAALKSQVETQHQSLSATELRRLLADLNVQISAVDRQLRTLTGRAEELEFQNRELRGELDLLRREITALSSVGGDAGRAVQTVSPALDPSATSSAKPAGAGTTADGRPGQARQAGPATGPGTAATAAPPNPAVALPDGDATAQFQYAFDFIRKNELENGRKAMELFLATEPEGDIRGNGHFWLGRVNLQLGRPGEAARQFLALIDRFPTHEKRPDALFELAQVLFDLDSGTEACSALAELQRTRDAASGRLLRRAERLAESKACD